jgi:hypothetical protein
MVIWPGLAALGLAMTTESSIRPYPAKIICAWDDGIIERPFMRPVAAGGLDDLHDYCIFAGIPDQSLFNSAKDDESYLLVYRSSTQSIIGNIYHKGDPQDRHVHAYPFFNSSSFDRSTPASSRYFWFHEKMKINLGFQNERMYGGSIRRTLGIPVWPGALGLKDSFKDYWRSFPVAIPLSPEKIDIFMHRAFSLLIDCFSIIQDIYLNSSTGRVGQKAEMPMYNAYSPEDRIKQEAQKKEYNEELQNIIDAHPFGDLWISAKLPVIGDIHFPFHVDPIGILFERGLAECDEDHDARVQKMLNEGCPQYMDGYESMVQLIGDMSKSLAMVSNEDFRMMFP